MIQIADRVVERMELSREARFAAALKGLVEVHGRISAPFSLLVAFGGRVREHDADFTRYRDFLALHVDQDKVSQYLILIIRRPIVGCRPGSLCSRAGERTVWWI